MPTTAMKPITVERSVSPGAWKMLPTSVSSAPPACHQMAARSAIITM